MIKNLDDYLIGIAIGIRFRANFSIEDQLGRMVDQILYSNKSFFNPSVFPLVRSNIGRRTLVNEKTNDRLLIDNSNIILELQFSDSATFKMQDHLNILSKFESDIIKGIMRSFAIREIVRIGYIRRYLFQERDLAKVFIDKTIGQTLEGVNDINLRFSKKMPSNEGMIKKGVADHENAIFNIIKKSDADEIFMSVDFQKIYDPFLPTALEINFSPFISEAESFNNKQYLPWLNKNYIEVDNE